MDIWKPYCEKLIELYRETDVLSIPDLAESRRIPLEKLYVPLRFSSQEDGEKEMAEEALNKYHFLVILGDPGSGKSTLVEHTAVKNAKVFLESGKGLVPIPIILRDYMQHHKERDFIGHFLQRLDSDLQMKQKPTQKDLKKLCYQSNALFLVDGIDEVGDAALRKEINQKITDLLKEYPGARIWCTSRIVGYAEAPLATVDEKKEFVFNNSLKFLGSMDIGMPSFNKRKSHQFIHKKINPFNQEQIARFIKQWYEIREHNPRERMERTETLQAAVQSNKRIAALAANPLTLSMIAMVHRKLARLPEERAELYRVLTESLLEHWELQKYRNIIPGGNPLATKQRRMEHLAEHMMGITPEEGSTDRAILLPGDKVAHIFSQTILDKEHLYRGKKPESKKEADNFLHYIKTRTGLLMERGRDNFSFVHLSFQEYLTAAYLKRYYLNRWVELIKEYKTHMHDSRWEEAFLLFFELVALNNEEDTSTLCLKLLDMPEPPLHLVVILVQARPELSEEVKRELADMLCKGILQENYEPFFSPLQKDWRSCIDGPIGDYCWDSFQSRFPHDGGGGGGANILLLQMHG